MTLTKVRSIFNHGIGAARKWGGGSMTGEFPGREWARARPREAGFDTAALDAAGRWLADKAAGRGYRVVIAREGRIVAEWNAGIAPGDRVILRSASKSAYTLLLGIAVAEGVLPGLDAPVADIYPEFIDVAPGEGPRQGRHAFPANADITCRQLIGNTSGYLKPEQEPGRVFDYQTFGMNVFSNAIATAYGLYDSAAPDRLPGCAALVDEKIRQPIGGTWKHGYFDFDFGDNPKVKKGVFGHGLHLLATAHDATRLGHLWLHGGRWGDRQVVPAAYLTEAIRTNTEIMHHGSAADHKYGLGFWTNDHGQLWADLPRDIFGAWGGNAKYIWVCPQAGTVISMVPAPWDDVSDEGERRALERAFIGLVLAAIQP